MFHHPSAARVTSGPVSGLSPKGIKRLRIYFRKVMTVG
jgi:hypothetical protein